MLNSKEKAKIIEKHKKSENDTGSTSVQIALLTSRINELQYHFAMHKKDNHSRRGLLKMVNNRKKLLKYLSRSKNEDYKTLIEELNIRK